MKICPFDEKVECPDWSAHCAEIECPTWLRLHGIQHLQRAIFHRDNCQLRLEQFDEKIQKTQVNK